MPCGDTKVITEQLRERFKEIPIIMGIADDGAKSLMSLWTNVDNGSWTLVATKDELSCIIGTGKSLKVIELGKTI
jgi:hexokinase